jgi:hypothetical protein
MHSINHFTCPFEHIILRGKSHCSQSSKDCVAEKEFGACINKKASDNCQALYLEIRKNSKFLLKNHSGEALSVGQQNKIKMGGLIAINEIINNETAEEVSDIFQLLQQVKEEYKNYSNLPFNVILPKISKYKYRQRS